MKIIYTRVPGYDWVSIPSDAVVRSFEKLGHTVYITDNPFDYPADKYDFIFSPYETTVLLARQISEATDTPVMGHLEWLPPWRIFEDIDVSKYGYKGNEPDLENRLINKDYYLNIGKIWKRFEVKTLSTEIRYPYLAKLLGDFGYHIRYPSVDVDLIERIDRQLTPKRQNNMVITVSRAVADKRYDLLVDVMNKVKTKCTWGIVGDGYMLKYVKDNLTNKKVELQLYGPKWNVERFYIMKQAGVFLGGSTAMPPIEGALLGCQPFLMAPSATDEIPEFDQLHKYQFGDAIMWSNKPEELAKLIDTHINNYNESYVFKIKHALMNNKLNILPAEENAKKLIEMATNEFTIKT